MVQRLGISALVLMGLSIAFLGTPAQASDFGCGSHVWSSPYPADLSDLYNVGALRLPPYFALHPPVYYEMPVPRTYGYGPWAYPPYITTPEIVEPTPEIIQNKFVPQPAKEQSAKPNLASAPKRIQNPYVTQIQSVADPALAAK